MRQGAADIKLHYLGELSLTTVPLISWRKTQGIVTALKGQYVTHMDDPVHALLKGCLKVLGYDAGLATALIAAAPGKDRQKLASDIDQPTGCLQGFS